MSSAESISSNGLETDNDFETSAETASTSVSYWRDRDGYAYVSDGTDIAHVHRLTLYAEIGDDLFDDNHQTHHELDKYADAPRWLDALTPREHARLHDDGDRTTVDGYPILRDDTTNG
ncbi:hypothetical protein [Salarchaeum sp. JOR-1]|uniref:hypothetical protein n=1 Tax=Salarchaeum sp. JOR-1 TaxID=2599399 RepID=UPI0011983D85|nr:hypothetical protein [Salarchaeum sp. JOR-1]QDX40851.1 hypothetical protein FQU85_08030 [Salarchaeum sp. JOR-1]